MHMAMSSVEHISVELFYIITHVSTVIIAIVSAPIGGCILLVIYRVIQRRRFTIQHSWRMVLVICLLFAAVEFTWFDAIKRIGAGRTSLILVPFETLATVIFAWILLSERLHKLQVLGGMIVLSGVILSITSTTGSENSIQFGIGEIEVIASALMSGLMICMITRLLRVKEHDAVETTGVLLLASGLILTIGLPFMNVEPVSGWTWLYLILIAPLVPLLLQLTNLKSLKSIGASITTIIWSCSAILTVMIAFILAQYGLPLEAPDNVMMAITGGVISVVGIGLIFRQ